MAFYQLLNLHKRYIHPLLILYYQTIQQVLLKFTTVKSEPGHCIVRCELDARNIFTGESWCVKIARQKCAMNVLENYPLLKLEMPKTRITI